MKRSEICCQQYICLGLLYKFPMATVVSYSYMARNVTYYARPQRIVKDCMKTRGLNNNIDFVKAFLEVRSKLMGGKEDQDVSTPLSWLLI